MKPIEKFLSAHPAARAFVTTPRPVAVSYGTQPFFGVNAFKFTNAQGKSQFGRYRIVPESGPAYRGLRGFVRPPHQSMRGRRAVSSASSPVIASAAKQPISRLAQHGLLRRKGS